VQHDVMSCSFLLPFSKPAGSVLTTRADTLFACATIDREIRTVATFRSSAFNTTEAKSYFINDCRFGDDVAKWLIAELRRQALKASERPGQEDFGWYINFQSDSADSTLIILFRPDDELAGKTWIGEIERNCGFLASLFGGRERRIDPSAVAAIHKILSSSPRIEELRWHFRRDFNQGREDLGTSSPESNGGPAHSTSRKSVRP